MSSQRGITFWGTVVAVWTALKLKKQYDEYNAVSTNDPEGRIHLPDSAVGEDDVSMLDTTIRTRRQKKKPGCCLCCGIDCTLFWKAFAFVLALWSFYGVFKFARWAITPSPTGLEGMPVFGQALGCDHASVYYKDSPDGYTLNAPIPSGPGRASHSIKLMGSGVGTLIITAAPSDATEISYKIVMKGTDKSLLDLSSLVVEKTTFASSLNIDTPQISRSDLSTGAKCVQFDIILAVPPTLEQLYISSYSTLQVKFDDDVHLELQRLGVTLFSNDQKNMIVPHSQIHASDDLTLSAYNGWIVGDVSVSKSALIDTQRGDGVANVKVYPTSGNAGPASFRTATGSGRSDFFYISDKANKRPIESRHVSSKNGDVYLRYAEADFNGKIALKSRSSTIWGRVTDLKLGRGSRPKLADEDETEWTHTRGDAEGGDRLSIESNGWTGLYF